jgi:hypothetical protein
VETSLFFSCDYATARSRFRDTVAALGWELLSYPIDARGPNGEELTIEVAVGAGADTDRALVLSSGIHGVEGFFGSAVQLTLLREWAGRRDALPAIRLVFLHRLNPFGFAWRRRFNEENGDLNRNLLPEGEPFRGSPPRYAELDKLLNPQHPPLPWELVTLKFLVAIARYGMPALKQAVASGQYDFPKGLFFGGDRPSRMSAVLSTHLDRWLGDNRRVMHLEFHTGLGAWANYPLTEGQRQRLSRWFGSDAFEENDPNKLAYPVRGSFGQWCVARARGRDYLYAAATERTKRQLVELFCPQSESWSAHNRKAGGPKLSRAVIDW